MAAGTPPGTGFTTATGDFLDVVERYTARVPSNPLAPFLPRLRELDQAGGVVPSPG